MMRLEFRYLVCSPNLNAHGTLHGGELLRWIDESVGMHARKLTRRVCVTRFIDKVDFISTARSGDIINIVTTLEHCGQTSLIFRVEAKEEISNRKVAAVGRVVFVAIDDKGQPVPHNVKTDD
jgi:acyl-CoA thioesterase YciA